MATRHISDIQLFNALKTKLGAVQFVTEEVTEQMPGIATKDFVNARISETEVKISETKFQIILWAFVFWVIQLGAMFAFIKFSK